MTEPFAAALQREHDKLQKPVQGRVLEEIWGMTQDELEATARELFWVLAEMSYDGQRRQWRASAEVYAAVCHELGVRDAERQTSVRR